MPRPFDDRRQGGRLLAERLSHYGDRDDVVVLGLARGGIPVAFEVANALAAPLDVFVVRKLGVPGHEELAMGAIASGGVRVLNDDVVTAAGIDPQEIEDVSAREAREVERRERLYRGDRGPVPVSGRVVIVVDDGLATGASMRAAIEALGERGADRVVVAVPAASPRTCAEFEGAVDEIVCAITPEPFLAVGQWYLDFAPTSDEEVRELLERARSAAGTRSG